MSQRLAAWREVSGRNARFVNIDVADDYHRLLTLIRGIEPHAIVHFVKQRVALYSMKSSWHVRYTIGSNIQATHNLLAAVVESKVDPHVVHPGTMAFTAMARRA